MPNRPRPPKKRIRPEYQGEWPRIAKAFVAEWVKQHGWVCPGYGVPSHPSTDLCADHLQPGDPSELRIACRGCNTRKAKKIT